MPDMSDMYGTQPLPLWHGRGKNAFVTKDSGEREDYDSGMRRDTQNGKPDYSLIDRPFLRRWAWLMTRGAEKYGKRNWEKANSREELERFEASALRHMYQWLDGDAPEEDHAAAVAFNVAAAEHVKAKLETAHRTEDVLAVLREKLQEQVTENDH